jgi:hypothetical protein
VLAAVDEVAGAVAPEDAGHGGIPRTRELVASPARSPSSSDPRRRLPASLPSCRARPRSCPLPDWVERGEAVGSSGLKIERGGAGPHLRRAPPSPATPADGLLAVREEDKARKKYGKGIEKERGKKRKREGKNIREKKGKLMSIYMLYIIFRMKYKKMIIIKLNKLVYILNIDKLEKFLSKTVIYRSM